MENDKTLLQSANEFLTREKQRLQTVQNRLKRFTRTVGIDLYQTEKKHDKTQWTKEKAEYILKQWARLRQFEKARGRFKRAVMEAINFGINLYSVYEIRNIKNALEKNAQLITEKFNIHEEIIRQNVENVEILKNFSVAMDKRLYWTSVKEQISLIITNYEIEIENFITGAMMLHVKRLSPMFLSQKRQEKILKSMQNKNPEANIFPSFYDIPITVERRNEKYQIMLYVPMYVKTMKIHQFLNVPYFHNSKNVFSEIQTDSMFLLEDNKDGIELNEREFEKCIYHEKAELFLCRQYYTRKLEKFCLGQIYLKRNNTSCMLRFQKIPEKYLKINETSYMFFEHSTLQCEKTTKKVPRYTPFSIPENCSIKDTEGSFEPFKIIQLNVKSKFQIYTPNVTFDDALPKEMNVTKLLAKYHTITKTELDNLHMNEKTLDTANDNFEIVIILIIVLICVFIICALFYIYEYVKYRQRKKEG